MNRRYSHELKRPYIVRCYYCLEVMVEDPASRPTSRTRTFIHKQSVRALDTHHQITDDCPANFWITTRAKNTISKGKVRYSAPLRMTYTKLSENTLELIQSYIYDGAFAYYNR